MEKSLTISGFRAVTIIARSTAASLDLKTSPEQTLLGSSGFSWLSSQDASKTVPMPNGEEQLAIVCCLPAKDEEL